MPPARRPKGIPRQDVLRWVRFLELDVDLDAFVDPFAKDAELAGTREEWQDAQAKLFQLRTQDRTNPLVADLENKKEMLKLVIRGKEKVSSEIQEAVPNTPPEEVALQNSALALAREVGMEGLDLLRTLLARTGEVKGLEEMVPRSACVESILKEAGLEEEAELRKAVALVKMARKAPGLDEDDILGGARQFLKRAIRQQAKVGTDTDLQAVIALFLAARQTLGLQDTNEGGDVIKMVNKLLVHYHRTGGGDNFEMLLVMQTQAGGFPLLQDKVR
ncbi:uncharacterized protein N0V89_002039 [Didymosphaeria variabile]|uniref:Uncharacterized protein n=1 Tax=Didymosphaeria variabile TaxID=1932322 RepID=A0A9W8XS12_9PLEO|nr:uncharacterized protein N0V89_002039 [Didymosphaeria variabile]KAJ4357464.1 hypothetical protein N0V89_002039 [Didymosphaeria variabile]